MNRAHVAAIISAALLVSPLVALAQAGDVPPPDTGYYCPNLTLDLKRGDSDTAKQGQVTELQKFLSSYYDDYPDSSTTGFFGNTTQKYVKRFQSEQNLFPVAGYAGPKTRAAIARVCPGKTTVSPQPTLPPPTCATGQVGTYPNCTTISAQGTPKYLLFQLFTSYPSSGAMAAFVSDGADLQRRVGDILNKLGDMHGDHRNTQLGFAVAVFPFDLTDDQLRTVIRNAFIAAEANDVAVAFHIDDSMFWVTRKDLWSDKNNVEWADWNGTIVPHRIIDWFTEGQNLAPPMCYNSPAITAEATRIARDVIGAEIKKGVDHLNTIGKPYLFAGVIAGWETRMSDDSQPHVDYGYCALHNLGYSAQKPPADFGKTVDNIVSTWIQVWDKALEAAGIPSDRVYTHIALPQQATPDPAFNSYSHPGFSAYGVAFGSIYPPLATHGNPPWGVSEGTADELSNAFSEGASLPPDNMEQYLAGVFNHGGVYVNIFGWNPTSLDPLGKATTDSSAIAAYQKYLRGEPLLEGNNPTAPSPPPQPSPSGDLSSKIQKIQTTLPSWLSQHPDQQPAIQSLMTKLSSYIQAANAVEAEKVADEILSIIETSSATQPCPAGTTGMFPNCTPAVALGVPAAPARLYTTCLGSTGVFYWSPVYGDAISYLLFIHDDLTNTFLGPNSPTSQTYTTNTSVILPVPPGHPISSWVYARNAVGLSPEVHGNNIQCTNSMSTINGD